MNNTIYLIQLLFLIFSFVLFQLSVAIKRDTNIVLRNLVKLHQVPTFMQVKFNFNSQNCPKKAPFSQRQHFPDLWTHSPQMQRKGNALQICAVVTYRLRGLAPQIFSVLGTKFKTFFDLFFTCSEKSAENLFWLQCLMVNLEPWKVAFLAKNQSYRSKFVLKWTKPKSKQMCLFTFFSDWQVWWST